MQDGKETAWVEEKKLLGAEDVAELVGVNPVDLETTLEQQERLTELVDARKLVIKTAAVEEALGEWPASELGRVQFAHSAIILASEDGLSLSRSTPTPPS